MIGKKELLWPYVQSLGFKRQEYEELFESERKEPCPCINNEKKGIEKIDEEVAELKNKNVLVRKDLFPNRFTENTFFSKLQKSDPFLYGVLKSEPPGHFVPRIKRDRHLTTYQIDFMGLEKCYTDNDTMLNVPKERKCNPDPRGIGCVYLECMKYHKDKIAQIDGETGKTQTFGELLVRCVRTARALKAYGIQTNHVISQCTLNHLDACVPLMASMLIGAKFCSLDPVLAQGDCLHVIKQMKPKILFVGVESIPLVEMLVAQSDLTPKLIIFGDSQKYMSFEEFLQTETPGGEWNFEARPVKDIHETAVILLSSGTTDFPKCFELPHYGILYNCSYLLFERSHDVIMYMSSYFWISAIILLTAATMKGMTRVTAKFNPTAMLKYIELYKVNMTFVAPAMTYLWFVLPRGTDYDTSSLKEMFIGGDRISDDQLFRLAKKFPHTILSIVYGMTEACGVIAFWRPYDTDLLLQKPRSCGRFTSGFKFRVVDPDTGKLLGPNQEGELCFKSDIGTNGYYNNREKSERELWDKDGYLHSGDIVYYDEDYCLYIVDRVKDLLKYDGWQIAPAIIEEVILSHPAVQSTVVVGKKDFMHGDLAMAAVILKSGYSTTEEDILKYCNERVEERYKLRAGVFFIKNIPLTPTGKVWRRKVREMLLEMQEEKN